MWTWILSTALGGSSELTSRDEYLAAVSRMVVVVGQMSTATYTFHKQEWVGEAQQPRQVMQVKYRRSGDLYLKYVGKVHPGREVLYRPGPLPGEILVNPSALLPTMTFELDGRIARSGERYTIEKLSLHRTAERYRADIQRLEALDFVGFDVTDLGPRLVSGEQAHCWLTVLPKKQDPDLYALQVETCLSDRTQVVVSMKAWDRVGGELVLVEDYTWADLQLDVPLSDADFEPELDEYGF